MDVIPLAAETLGVRSMATLVDTGSVRVLIDPGVTLSPNRYGLPPTTAERQAYEEASARIIGALCQVDAVVVTRYHEEHLNLLPYVLSSAAVYLKEPGDAGERRQAKDLLQRLERTGRSFELVSGQTVNWRNVSLTFSPPLPEGASGPGPVMAVAVRTKDRCFVHGSDAQGPLSPAAMEWFLQQRPDLVYLSGAATYRIGFRHSERSEESRRGVVGTKHAHPHPNPLPQGRGELCAADLKTCRAHLSALLRFSGCRVILDHLLFRDPAGKRWFADLFEDGRVQSAAAYLGLPERPLEARRRDASQMNLAALPPLEDEPEVIPSAARNLAAWRALAPAS